MKKSSQWYILYIIPLIIAIIIVVISNWPRRVDSLHDKYGEVKQVLSLLADSHREFIAGGSTGSASEFVQFTLKGGYKFTQEPDIGSFSFNEVRYQVNDDGSEKALIYAFFYIDGIKHKMSLNRDYSITREPDKNP